MQIALWENDSIAWAGVAVWDWQYGSDSMGKCQNGK